MAAQSGESAAQDLALWSHDLGSFFLNVALEPDALDHWSPDHLLWLLKAARALDSLLPNFENKIVAGRAAVLVEFRPATHHAHDYRKIWWTAHNAAADFADQFVTNVTWLPGDLDPLEISESSIARIHEEIKAHKFDSGELERLAAAMTAELLLIGAPIRLSDVVEGQNKFDDAMLLLSQGARQETLRTLWDRGRLTYTAIDNIRGNRAATPDAERRWVDRFCTIFNEAHPELGIRIHKEAGGIRIEK
jgi:hypothetical protein